MNQKTAPKESQLTVDLDGVRLLIFDADGTLRRCTVPGQVCPNRDGEWELLPNVKETLARFDWHTQTGGMKFGIVSNQGGVGLGYISEADAYQMLADMVVAATGGWPRSGTIRICPHAPSAGCACRKPKPGMLLALSRWWGEPAERVMYVGDMESDRQAAEAAGVRFTWAKDFFGWRELVLNQEGS